MTAPAVPEGTPVDRLFVAIGDWIVAPAMPGPVTCRAGSLYGGDGWTLQLRHIHAAIRPAQ